jgi:hypothetical protein
MPVIPALRRLRQENLKFEASLSNIAKSCLKKKKKKKRKIQVKGCRCRLVHALPKMK